MKNFRFVQVSPACVILASIETLWRAFWRASSSLRLCATWSRRLTAEMRSIRRSGPLSTSAFCRFSARASPDSSG
jgi:hypothetical protein